MKKGIYPSLLLSAILLAACNAHSDEVIDTSASPESSTSEVQPPKTAKQITPSQAAPEEVITSKEQQVAEQPQVAVNESKVSLISVASSTLNYTMQHPEGYTLTEEEPGKDMLFYNENDALSMRIEVATISDSSFDLLNRVTQQSLTDIAPNNTYESFDLTPYIATSQRTDITAYASYIVKYESDKVIAIVYEIKDKIITLTIFDDYITGITDTFIQAGLTIQ